MENNMEKFDNKNILVLGDIMLDIYHRCEVVKPSQENPNIPVLKIIDTQYSLGGAGNVINNIKSMGSNPIPIGIVGNDTNGTIIKTILESKGITTKYIVTSNIRPTIDKIRYTVNDMLVNRIDNDNSYCATDFENTFLISNLDKVLKSDNIDSIILQDYGKGVINHKTKIHLKNELNNNTDFKVSYSPSLKPYSVIYDPDLVCLNLQEACHYTNIHENSLCYNDLLNIFQSLSNNKNNTEIIKRIEKELRLVINGMQNYYKKDILITLGKYGNVIYYSHTNVNNIIFNIHPDNDDDNDIKNTTGAGDVILAFISCYMCQYKNNPIGTNALSEYTKMINLCDIIGNLVIRDIRTSVLSKTDLQYILNNYK